MESGCVLGTTTDIGYMGNIPMTIGWNSGPPAGRGPGDQVRSERLALVGPWIFSRDPRFPAWRCQNCRLVVFTYDKPVYDPKADQTVAQPREEPVQP